ncbi:NAD(P)/FAD-dependent oxidoreductase [Actinoplanes sp. TFC3]|uniref:NAD(P)/FAD-dependent oxidoreductase n=1 Tax=Actinoplanes sp. TFC3 TaxID=1710355 RepID=UPI00082FF21B|nr:NAD(P)/FAD-dependent oxidoreductase [Actinoplanes sp. TFC3]
MTEVVIIGGGAAGLNGALMLARSRRSVVVIDAGQPRNAPAAGVHGLLGREGMPPAELLARGRAEVEMYGGTIRPGTVDHVTRDGDGFVVALGDGTSLRARRILVASGLVDELPDVPGLRERWGKDVLHCPYCHGWEARDKAIGVLATSPMSMHQALLFRQLSDDITLFTHTCTPAETAALVADEKLAALGIRVVAGKVAEIVTEAADRLTGVRLEDGTLVSRDVVTVAARMVPRVGFLAGLGIKPIEHPSGMGDYVPADPTGLTEVAGVWIAGNATDLAAQVGSAAAAGALAGARINADLVEEDTAAAVRRYSSPSKSPSVSR